MAIIVETPDDGSGFSSDLVQRVLEYLGELSVLTTPTQILAWLNEGIARFPAVAEKQVDLAWASADTQIALPGDYVRNERVDVRQGQLRPFDILGKKMIFGDPMTSPGTGVMYYWGYFTPLVSGADSGLPPIGDVAAVSYALSRFFRMLSGSRADYRRYATITGQNGVDIGELDALAERHHQDFLEARDELENLEFGEPATFYGG